MTYQQVGQSYRPTTGISGTAMARGLIRCSKQTNLNAAYLMSCLVAAVGFLSRKEYLLRLFLRLIRWRPSFARDSISVSSLCVAVIGCRCSVVVHTSWSHCIVLSCMWKHRGAYGEIHSSVLCCQTLHHYNDKKDNNHRYHSSTTEASSTCHAVFGRRSASFNNAWFKRQVAPSSNQTM